MSTWKTIFFTLLLLVTSANSLGAAGELVQAVENRRGFLLDTGKQKHRSNWLKMIDEFERAATLQPDPRHASRARYLGADVAWRSGIKFKQKDDFVTGEKLSRRSVRDCNRCTHSAAAQLLNGRLLLELNDLDGADKQLKKVELNYPHSPEVAEARLLLSKIGGGSTPIPEKEITREYAASIKKETTAPKDNNPAQPTKETTAPKDKPTQPTKETTAPKDKPTQSTKETTAPKDKPTQPTKEATAPKGKPAIKLPPMPSPRDDGQAQVYFLSLEEHESYTTVTAYVDKVTPYLYNLIPPSQPGGSFRAYADLLGSVIAPKTKISLNQKTPMVRLVKINQFKKDVVRLVLDLAQDYPYRPTFMESPPRLIFQVAKVAKDLPPPADEAHPEPPAPPSWAITNAPPKNLGRRGPGDSLVRQLGLKIERVVIDPGHGGRDGGTSGYGLREKDMVLKLAKKLQTRLQKELGLTVYLTRSDDRSLTLEQRIKIGRDKKADLFISLHVNANTSPRVEGFETYILNFATDKSAMAVAARENASSDKNVAELDGILRTITKNTKMAESRMMAQMLHKATVGLLNKRYKVRDLGVKEAPFYVLVGTNVPSTLVEIGFLSNRREAERMRQDKYLDIVAEGLTQGLESYINGF